MRGGVGGLVWQGGGVGAALDAPLASLPLSCSSLKDARPLERRFGGGKTRRRPFQVEVPAESDGRAALPAPPLRNKTNQFVVCQRSSCSPPSSSSSSSP